MDLLDVNLRNLGPAEIMLVPFIAPLIQFISHRANEIVTRVRERGNESPKHSSIENKVEDNANENVSEFLARSYELFTTVFEANIKILAEELLDDGEDAILKVGLF